MSDHFYQAWYWLLEECEKRKTGIMECLSIEVVKINPETDRVEDDEVSNTEVSVWLEWGWPEWSEELGRMVPTHDIRYDTGGKTFEEAIVNLKNLLKS